MQSCINQKTQDYDDVVLNIFRVERTLRRSVTIASDYHSLPTMSQRHAKGVYYEAGDYRRFLYYFYGISAVSYVGGGCE